MQGVELIKQAIKEKGQANIPFSGRSMYPTLKDSMMVTISDALPQKIKISDIIAYQQNDQMVAHRVINVIRDNGVRSFLTRGDNQPFGGISLIEEKDLIGKIQRAFYADDPGKTIAIHKYAWLYLISGRLYLFYRENIRQHLPESFRILLKNIVKGLYSGLNRVRIA